MPLKVHRPYERYRRRQRLKSPRRFPKPRELPIIEFSRRQLRHGVSQQTLVFYQWRHVWPMQVVLRPSLNNVCRPYLLHG